MYCCNRFAFWLALKGILCLGAGWLEDLGATPTLEVGVDTGESDSSRRKKF